MKYPFLILTVFQFLTGHAQKKIYTDEFGRRMAPWEASHYQIVQKDGAVFSVRTYPINSEIPISDICYKNRSKTIREGNYLWYHKNGVISEAGEFKSNIKAGIWKKYYESGKIECMYAPGEHVKYLQYWTEDGDSILTNGSGVLKTRVNEKSVRFVEFKDSVKLVSYQILGDPTDTVYTFLEKQPELIVGFPALSAHISQIMIYPLSAKANGIQGTVYVRFVVNEQGRIEQTEVVKGIGYGCDEQAVKALVEADPRWTPGEYLGRKVKVSVVLPIIFKL